MVISLMMDPYLGMLLTNQRVFNSRIFAFVGHVMIQTLSWETNVYICPFVGIILYNKPHRGIRCDDGPFRRIKLDNGPFGGIMVS